jgi:nucleoside-diphosphate-sugar epimerase
LTGKAVYHKIPSVKVLVTGGTGFVGSHLVDRLLERPDTEVFALVRNPKKTRWLAGPDRVGIVEGDLFNVPPLAPGIDVVYHSAGLTKTFKSSGYYTVNAGGTQNLLESLAAQGLEPRFIHLSSLAASGPSSPGRPVREEDLPRPLSPYGLSKLRAEEKALGFKDRFYVAVLRIGAVYGPRDEDFLDYFRWVARGVVPVLGSGDRRISLCYVGDVVEACLKAAEADVPSGEIFNIAREQPVSWTEFAEAAARVLGKKVRKLKVPLWVAFLAACGSDLGGRVLNKPKALNLKKFREMKAPGWVADTGKAKTLLGFEVRLSLEEGLKKTLAWYLENGLL